MKDEKPDLTFCEADEQPYLTCREAAELAGFTTRHIQNLIKRGKLSAQRSENGSFTIQKAEFFRYFPGAFQNNQAKASATLGGHAEKIILENEIKYLKEMLREKDKNTDYLKEQIENFNQERAKILDTLGSNQRLLEHTTEEMNSIKKKKKRFWF